LTTLFLVVVLKTQARTTKLTTPTVQISPDFLKKIKLLFYMGVHALSGVNLQLCPVNLPTPIFFSAVGLHVHAYGRKDGRTAGWTTEEHHASAAYCWRRRHKHMALFI